MLKRSKTIRVEVDNHVFLSHQAPDPIDEFDGSCPCCGSSRYEELLTITQHGFEVDQCVTLVSCRTCYETFHYVYEMPAVALDEVTNNA